MMQITKRPVIIPPKKLECLSDLIDYCRDSLDQVFFDDDGGICFISDNYAFITTIASGVVYTYYLNDDAEINWPLSQVISPFALEIDPKD